MFAEGKLTAEEGNVSEESADRVIYVSHNLRVDARVEMWLSRRTLLRGGALDRACHE